MEKSFINRIRRSAAVILTVTGVMTGLSGCRFNYEEPEKVMNKLDQIAENIGRSQITDGSKLIGERNTPEDVYTGDYDAECTDETGRDVIFGGASIKERELRLSGSIYTESGKGKVRIRQNDDVQEYTADENGKIELSLTLGSGGNYIMMDYENFTGRVELYSVYVQEAK